VTAPALDLVIHEPTRLRICGILGQTIEVEFGTLRDLLEVADSVLSKHLKTLEVAGYVQTSRQKASTGRPRTWAKLTPSGRAAFQAHVAELRRLANDLRGQYS
jgi:DNA-binding MarR family transcriptional regulator